MWSTSDKCLGEDKLASQGPPYTVAMERKLAMMHAPVRGETSMVQASSLGWSSRMGLRMSISSTQLFSEWHPGRYSAVLTMGDSYGGGGLVFKQLTSSQSTRIPSCSSLRVFINDEAIDS